VSRVSLLSVNRCASQVGPQMRSPIVGAYESNSTISSLCGISNVIARRKFENVSDISHQWISSGRVPSTGQLSQNPQSLNSGQSPLRQREFRLGFAGSPGRIWDNRVSGGRFRHAAQRAGRVRTESPQSPEFPVRRLAELLRGLENEGFRRRLRFSQVGAVTDWRRREEIRTRPAQNNSGRTYARAKIES
jgi:hypothetical protein